MILDLTPYEQESWGMPEFRKIQDLLKTYENFREFDADFVMAKIKHFYSDFKIKEMFDEELPNWVDENEVVDKYEDVCDWFYDSHSEEQLKKWYINRQAL